MKLTPFTFCCALLPATASLALCADPSLETRLIASQIPESRVAEILAQMSNVTNAPALPAASGTFLTSIIDGDFSEWASISPSVTIAGLPVNAGSAHITSVLVGNDTAFLYIYLSYYNQADGYDIVTFLDNDANSFTGESDTGFEALWVHDSAYDYRNVPNGFGTLINGDTISSVTGHNVAQGREFSIPLNATFASDGSPVFPYRTFTLEIFDPLRSYSVPFTYTLAIPEPSPLLVTAGLSLFYLLRRRPVRCG